MADYISREAAVKIAERYGLSYGSVLGRHSGIADCIASEIESIPAADVVEVVRCKDCKYRRKNDENEPYCTAKDGLLHPLDEEFCSRGEK